MTMQAPQNAILAGLGALAVLQSEGLGALGPLGNAGSILPGKYKSTGDGVNVRSSGSFSSGIKGTLNVGDVVEATGKVEGDESPGTSVNPRGELVNFAEVKTVFGTGWVAIEYLAPAGAGEPISGGGGGGGDATPVKYVEPTDGSGGFFDEYGNYILGGAAVVGAGVILYALTRKKKKR